MALWGNNDNLQSTGTVSLNYDTKEVIGTGTTFGTVGFGVTGDIIRFGTRGFGIGVTYFGDAVIVGIASTTSCTIGSTEGLNGVAIGGTSYHLSQLPKSSILDQSFSNKNTNFDKIIYGIGDGTSQLFDSDDHETEYTTSGSGWVGVTTYVDCHGELRVKHETLVAMSGIQTGANSIPYPTQEP
tara:strand:+ start:18 stop:569 length:552 start_codon:yes stop_codon:yes gene_type:complete